MKKLRRTRGLIAVALFAMVPVLATSQQASYYVLDGFGGVHAGGDAPAITPATPFFGFDIARDLAYVAVGKRLGTVDVVGDGLLVLDGFGGIHAGGVLPRAMTTPTTPYFGFDVARAITARNVPPRISGRLEPAFQTVLLNDNDVTVATATLRAPDDGFLLVMASLQARCLLGGSGSVQVNMVVSVGVDSTSPGPGAHEATLPECNVAGAHGATETFTLVQTHPVTAGAHFVHLLVRAHQHGTVAPDLRVGSRSLQLLFIDHDGMGGS